MWIKVQLEEGIHSTDVRFIPDSGYRSTQNRGGAGMGLADHVASSTLYTKPFNPY
jgi:hypothetical protein